MILKILLLILLIPVIILSIVLIMNVLPLPGPLDSIRDQIAAVAAGFFSFLYLLWIAIYIVFSFRRAGKKFDNICISMGLEGTSLALFGRKYSGKINERNMIIEYFPPKMVQRALLNIYVESDNKFEFAISRQKPLLGNTRYAEADSLLKMPGDFKIYSKDCTKVKKLILNQDFNRAIEALLHWRDLKQIFFEKKGIWLHQRTSYLSGDTLKEYIKNLLIIADEAEASK